MSGSVLAWAISHGGIGPRPDEEHLRKCKELLIATGIKLTENESKEKEENK